MPMNVPDVRRCPWAFAVNNSEVLFAECIEEYCAMWGHFMGVAKNGDEMWDAGCTVGRTVMVE